MLMTQQLLVEFGRRSASVEIAFDYTIIMAVWMRLRGARRCVLVWVGVSYFILCYGAGESLACQEKEHQHEP